MLPDAFDAISRRAAASITRRTSLLTLGGAAVTAALAKPEFGAAKKKNRKKNRKKCKKKEKRRCNNDVADCAPLVVAFCAGDATCIAQLTPCCDTCSANGFLTCLDTTA